MTISNQRVVRNYLRDAASQPDIHIAQVLHANPPEVHFSVQGPRDTAFEGGIYHGKIVLPKNFPYEAPSLQLLTPSGRFSTQVNICIDGYTAWHKDNWSPKSFSQIIRALQSLFSDVDESGVGYDFPVNPEEVRKQREQSRVYKCLTCGTNHAELVFADKL